MSDSTHEDFHTGPIKTPKQLLITVVASFLVPVFVIIALVMYVSSGTLPAGSGEADEYALGGVSAQDLQRGVAERIRKVGTVEIRDANRPLHSGEEVFKAQCTACHSTGAAGAPKIGDAAAWAARLQTGFEALVHSAVGGKGAMPAFGEELSEKEIATLAAWNDTRVDLDGEHTVALFAGDIGDFAVIYRLDEARLDQPALEKGPAPSGDRQVHHVRHHIDAGHQPADKAVALGHGVIVHLVFGMF